MNTVAAPTCTHAVSLAGSVTVISCAHTVSLSISFYFCMWKLLRVSRCVHPHEVNSQAQHRESDRERGEMDARRDKLGRKDIHFNGKAPESSLRRALAEESSGVADSPPNSTARTLRCAKRYRKVAWHSCLRVCRTGGHRTSQSCLRVCRTGGHRISQSCLRVCRTGGCLIGNGR